MAIDLTLKFNGERLSEFAQEMQRISRRIGFRVSARGWCYLLEQARMINKDKFDKAENLINTCRREGLLPVDFVAEEDSRAFVGVESPSDKTIKGTLQWMCRDVLTGDRYFTPDWWNGEDYYVQMLVEKIDLKTLFEPVTSEYHIPIANSKGWSSILQRAEYARRFKEAEAQGLQCVLLYCGDHDPDGLRISDTIRKNLEQVADVQWEDGEEGYDPENLEITRFGLNYDFITENGYTWIDNLITGSGCELARVINGKIVAGLKKNGKPHQNFGLSYLQDYLQSYGVRKCEANAVVTTPDAARDLCRDAIENIVGEDARERFADKRRRVRERYEELLAATGLAKTITKVIKSEDEEDDIYS